MGAWLGEAEGESVFSGIYGFNGYRISILQDEKRREMDGGDGCTS